MRRLAILTLAVGLCLIGATPAGADPPADPPIPGQPLHRTLRGGMLTLPMDW